MKLMVSNIQGGLLLLLFSVLPVFSFAQGRDFVDKTTDVAVFLPATTGVVLSLCHKDYTGLKQFALSGATAVAANYLLELAIKKERPDGSGNHAFPSTHVTGSFMGATFLQRRYGWKWGIPAYLLSAYVGWGRVYAKKHDWWDVVAGAALGAGASLIYTRPFAKKGNLVLAPATINKAPALYFCAQF